MTNVLPKRQKETLEVILRYRLVVGRYPKFTEIAQELGVSNQMARIHVMKLEEKGYVVRKGRSFELT